MKRINNENLIAMLNKDIGQIISETILKHKYNDKIFREATQKNVNDYAHMLHAKQIFWRYVVIMDETNNTHEVIESGDFRLYFHMQVTPSLGSVYELTFGKQLV